LLFLTQLIGPVAYAGISRGVASKEEKGLKIQHGDRRPGRRRPWGSGSKAPSRWRKFAIL